MARWKKRPNVKAMQEQNERSVLCYTFDDQFMGRRFHPNLVPVSTWNAIRRLKDKRELEQVDDALGGYRLTDAGLTRIRTLGLRTEELPS